MTRRPSLWQHDDFVRLWSPGLGGVLVQLLTAPVAILVDAVSFLSSAVLLVLIKHREDRPEQPGSDRPSLRQDVVAGLRYVLGDAYLRPILFAIAVASLFGIFSMVQALLALFAVRSLGVSPTGLGAVLAVANGGALLGTLANGWLTRRLGFGPAITISMAGHGGVAAAAPGHPYHCAAHAGHWHGTGLVLCLRLQHQPNRPPAGRDSGTNVGPDERHGAVRDLGIIPIGALLGGWLGGVMDLRSALWVAGLGRLTAVLPLLLSPVRHLREVPVAGITAGASNE
jgi:hypothetical protein